MIGVTEAPDYTVKKCAYTFDEDSQELALSQRHVRKLIVLNISDSTFTGLELCVPDSSRQQNGALRLIGDTYYPDGYEGRLTGLLRVFRHHGSETVKEWKQKWNLQ